MQLGTTTICNFKLCLMITETKKLSLKKRFNVLSKQHF